MIQFFVVLYKKESFLLGCPQNVHMLEFPSMHYYIQISPNPATKNTKLTVTTTRFAIYLERAHGISEKKLNANIFKKGRFLQNFNCLIARLPGHVNKLLNGYRFSS